MIPAVIAFALGIVLAVFGLFLLVDDESPARGDAPGWCCLAAGCIAAICSVLYLIHILQPWRLS